MLADETMDEQLERSENEAQWLRLERAVDQLNVEESVLIRLYYTEDRINNQDDENDHALRKLLSDCPCFMGYFGWGCS